MWTLEESTDFYNLSLEAYKSVTMGYTYEVSIGGDVQKLTRNEMSKIKAEMFYWKNIIDNMNTDAPKNNGKMINVGCNY